jgi:hypothetical protein
LSLRVISDLERGFHHTARKDTAVLLAEPLGLDEPTWELFVEAARGRAPAASVPAATSGLPGAGGDLAGRQAWMGGLIAFSYRGLSSRRSPT